MEPVEEALVKSCSVLDPHYAYTVPPPDVSEPQDGSDDEIDEYHDGNDSVDELEDDS